MTHATETIATVSPRLSALVERLRERLELVSRDPHYSMCCNYRLVVSVREAIDEAAQLSQMLELANNAIIRATVAELREEIERLRETLRIAGTVDHSDDLSAWRMLGTLEARIIGAERTLRHTVDRLENSGGEECKSCGEPYEPGSKCEACIRSMLLTGSTS